MQKFKPFIILSSLCWGAVAVAYAEETSISNTAPAFEIPTVTSITVPLSPSESTHILYKKTSTEQLTAFSNPLAGGNNVGQRPKVYIAGAPILIKKEIRTFVQNKMLAHLPPSLRFQHVRAALENRSHIAVFPHNPKQGRDDAPVVILEMADLSCLQCFGQLKKIDAIRKKYADDILYIHSYVPVDRYNTSNPAAFYSRLAHESGVFWEYREAMFSIEDLSEQSLVTTLVNSGLDTQNLRQNVRYNARQYYRELDADSQLANNLGIQRPPALFINGIRIGGAIKMDQVEDLIKYEIELAKQIKAEEK